MYNELKSSINHNDYILCFIVDKNPKLPQENKDFHTADSQLGNSDCNLDLKYCISFYKILSFKK